MFGVSSPAKEMGKFVRLSGQQTSEEQLLRILEVPGTLKLIKNRNNLIKVTFVLREENGILYMHSTVKVLALLVSHRKMSISSSLSPYHFKTSISQWTERSNINLNKSSHVLVHLHGITTAKLDNRSQGSTCHFILRMFKKTPFRRKGAVEKL